MIRLLVACVLVLVGQASAALADAPRPTVIVVDASGSMAAAMGGTTRLDAARGVLNEILGRWPASAPLGLVAYGHRRAGDCGDIEVLSPIGKLDAAALRKKYGALLARGKTPLAASLQQAAGMLKGAGQGGTIILVTDGIETCHPDPCSVAAALRAADAALVVHVIGFAVEAKDERQLSCIAEAGGGLYRTAANAGGLLDSLSTVARAATEQAPPPPPAPVTPAPAPPPMQAVVEPETVKIVRVSLVAVIKEEGPISDHAVTWRIDGQAGANPFHHEATTSLLELAVPAGRYTVQAATGNALGNVEAAVSGDAARIEVPLAAGRLKARVVPYKGAPPLDEREGLAWTLTPLDGQAAVTAPGEAKPALLLAAGRYRIAAEHKGRRAEAEAMVAGGRPVDLELSLRLGELQLSTALAEDAEPLTDWRGLSWRALKPDGTAAAEVTQQAAPLLVLPAGRYRVELAAAGATIAREFEVVEGKRQEARLVVPTGRRILSAALAQGLEPLTDWRDTSWTVTAIDAVGIAPGTAVMSDLLAASPTADLLPGRWRVSVKSGPATAEREIVVTPESEEAVRVDLQAARLQIAAAPEDGAPSPVNIVFEVFSIAADGSLGPAVLSVGASKSADTLLPVGRWRVSAVDDRDRRAEGTVELGAGEEKQLEMMLK
jgi:Ca-activated chloride channel homolog